MPALFPALASARFIICQDILASAKLPLQSTPLEQGELSTWLMARAAVEAPTLHWSRAHSGNKAPLHTSAIPTMLCLPKLPESRLGKPMQELNSSLKIVVGNRANAVCRRQKFCCGRTQRVLPKLYRPQSAVSCSTSRKRAA